MTGLISLAVALGAACDSNQPVAEPSTAFEDATSTPTNNGDATPPADWNRITGRGVSLSLPDTYEGADLENDVSVIAGRLKSRGPPFDALAKIIEDNPSVFVFMAFDWSSDDPSLASSVTIVRDRAISAETIDRYVPALIDGIRQAIPNARATLDKKMTIAGYPGARLIVEFSVPDASHTASYNTGSGIKESVYVLRDGSSFFAIAFSASAATFDELSLTFERAANTFAVTATSPTASGTIAEPALQIAPTVAPASMCGDRLTATFAGSSPLGQYYRETDTLTASVAVNAAGCDSVRVYFDGFLPIDSPWCAYWLSVPGSAASVPCASGGIGASLAVNLVTLYRTEGTYTFMGISGHIPPQNASSPPDTVGMRLCAVVLRFYSRKTFPKDVVLGDPCFTGPRLP